MAITLSLEDYLSSNSELKSAKSALDTAVKNLESIRYLTDQTAIQNLRTAKDKAQAKYDSVKAKVTSDFKTKYESLAKSQVRKDIAGLESSKSRVRSPEELKQIQTQIDTLKQELEKPQTYKEPVVETPKGPTVTQAGVTSTQATGGTGAKVDANADVTNLFNLISADENQLKAIQQDLRKNFPQFYTGGVGGVADWEKTNKALASISQKWLQSPAFARTQDFRTFLLKPAFPLTGTATGTASNISNPEEAQSLINSAFKAAIGREPTAQELADFSSKLKKYELKNPTVDLSGKTQFLTNEIRTLPDYAAKLKSIETTNTQTIKAAAKANGLMLDDAAIANYVEQLKNGVDINIIKNQIRGIVANTQPESIKKLMDQGVDLDTIYSPYKSAMASILEIPSAQIELNDPTLMSAINQQGTVPLYQFQTALRKDPRWQYTDNAKQTVSNSVLKVLQDFGFRG